MSVSEQLTGISGRGNRATAAVAAPAAVAVPARGARGPARLLGVVKGPLPLPVLIYLFTVVIPIGFDVGPLALTTLRLMLMVVIIPLTLQLFAGRFGPLRATDGFFMAYLFWSAVSLTLNSPEQMVQQIGSVGAEFFGGYMMGRAYIRTREDFIALCRTLVLIVCLLLPFALFEARTGRTLLLEFLRKIPGVSTPSIIHMEARLGIERVQVTFAHAIHWGLFCSVCFSLSFVALDGTMSTLRRWFSSGVVIGSGFLAMSSGALLAMVLQCSMIGWAAVFRSFRYRWWLLAALFVLAYITIDMLSNRRPIDVFMSYATFNSGTAFYRRAIYQWGMYNVWAHPFIGIGMRDWVRAEWMTLTTVDNFWLLVAMRFGAVGFSLLVSGYALAIFLIMRRDFSQDRALAQIRRAWVFTFLGLSFTLCTVHIWTNLYSFVFFMFGAGIWLIGTEPRRAAAPQADSTPPAPGYDARSDSRSPFSRFGPKPPRTASPSAPPSASPSGPASAPPLASAPRRADSYARSDFHNSDPDASDPPAGRRPITHRRP